ncbi:hypothetical protein [Vannielia litorea]|uniref:hypothetical protein n=1 Tax=Vannielia litorea TaxID=1217970 RepID=UPI001BCF5ABD|nr:hypothetical protein [Vannielia litorea]MBS8225592.1 hypothetical protein [Vannielia litorea]
MIKSKLGVVAAMAAMATRIGMPDASLAQEAQDVLQRCEMYQEINDRSELQRLLEDLLERQPDDPCIDYLAGLLGSTTVALIDDGDDDPEEPY